MFLCDYFIGNKRVIFQIPDQCFSIRICSGTAKGDGGCSNSPTLTVNVEEAEPESRKNSKIRVMFDTNLSIHVKLPNTLENSPHRLRDVGSNWNENLPMVTYSCQFNIPLYSFKLT